MSDSRKYVASFILDMHGYTETVEAVTNKLAKTISDLDGHVTEIKNLGQKKFERVADKKFSDGIYVQISFDGPATVPEGIKSKLKLDKVINRILIESVK